MFPGQGASRFGWRLDARACADAIRRVAKVSSTGPIRASRFPEEPGLLPDTQVPAGSRSPALSGRPLQLYGNGEPDAPPLLLLHGVGANAMHWRFQFAGLSDRFRVIAWNAPGYMFSDNLGDGIADRAGLRRRRDRFSGRRRDRDCDVLANSFGSRVAQCVAWFHPGQIARLVSTGTAIGQRDMTEAARDGTARDARGSGGGGRIWVWRAGGGAGRTECVGGNDRPDPARVARDQS